MITPRRVFFAYPSMPDQLGATIVAAAGKINTPTSTFRVQTWPNLDIPGRVVIDNVTQEIDASEFILADITRLNFNVTFEVAYALGKQKRVILVINQALSPETKEIEQLGIFDTLVCCHG
jgi:hypothetical protein